MTTKRKAGTRRSEPAPPKAAKVVVRKDTGQVLAVDYFDRGEYVTTTGKRLKVRSCTIKA